MESALASKTGLLLIDIQEGCWHPNYWGTERSTSDFESNVSNLLQSVRAHNAAHPQQPIEIYHVHNHSENPRSPLHPQKKLPNSDVYGAAPHSCAARIASYVPLRAAVGSATATGLAKRSGGEMSLQPTRRRHECRRGKHECLRPHYCGLFSGASSNLIVEEASNFR